MKKKKIEQRNVALLNIISPIGLKFGKNNLSVGENFGKAYGIVRYPEAPDYGWMSKLMNIPGTMASYHFKTIADGGDFIDSLNKNISHQRVIAKNTNDTLVRTRAQKAADDGEKLLVRIDQHGEAVGMLSTTIIPLADEPLIFEKVRRKTVSSIKTSRCKARLLSDLQKRAFKHMSPFYTEDDKIHNVTDRICPLTTLMGGFANASSGFNDSQGYYVAKDASGGLIILDFWLRSNDRTNTNFIILGIQGQGKSTAIRHIALSEFMRGTKVLFTDPHGENRFLTKKLGGEIINAGGGSNGRINPFQISVIPKDDEEEEVKFYENEDGHGMGDMALYIKYLEVFFSIYIPDLTSIEKAILKATIIELYNNFNIFWDTDISTLKPEDFPIWSDLHKLMLQKAEEKDKTRKGNDSNVYENLAILLQDGATGADSLLWNGHTTISSNARVICIDTKSLQDTPDNVKRAQNFNINRWTWQVMTENPTEPVLCLYDEAYLNIDPKVPQSMIFLRNGVKSSRKFEAAMGFITHSVVDFLDESVKMYGQALLDSPCYKIIFGTDGQNLKDITDLYKLTTAEQDLLQSKRRGHALMMIGSRRLHVNFDIPEYKFEYFGNAGGR
ncbi:hypothetical protein acsn021_11320 [Anaerocolumna cellulosilytica]|uniref:Uncharacterized protein n=1 Tax=Anaerocolumna cellulosilytica TaxID=433286 RepID=A0A6S6QQF3_9FIRM|nr:hypothetical protein [Anaerocolumna cellulosilytica]MBB5194618.1 hypothetical protein [Anaerocolumna cellulosilytica]BCJ93563.1 hypothetical protein acsn021_11320 [Anaerocolumna cellulosilytica]